VKAAGTPSQLISLRPIVCGPGVVFNWSPKIERNCVSEVVKSPLPVTTVDFTCGAGGLLLLPYPSSFEQLISMITAAESEAAID
jgi:hypothetical protein